VSDTVKQTAFSNWLQQVSKWKNFLIQLKIIGWSNRKESKCARNDISSKDFKEFRCPCYIPRSAWK